VSIAHVQTAVNTTGLAGGHTSISCVGSTIGTGNLVCGTCVWGTQTASDLTSVTTNQSQTATIVDKFVDATSNETVATFYLANVAAGTTTFTMNMASSLFTLEIAWDEYSGIATATPIDGHAGQYQINPGTGTDACTSTSIATTANGDLIYAVGYSMNTGITNLTAGTGFTNRSSSTGNGFNFYTADKVQSTAGSVAATWTADSGGNADTTGTMVMAFAVPATGRSITSSAPLGAFTQTAALKLIGKIVSAATLGAFANTAALKLIGKITSGATLGAFTQTATIGHGGSLTSSATLGAFTQSAPMKLIGKIVSSATLGAFTQSAPMKALAKITSSATLGAFTQTATLLRARQIAAAATLGNFTQDGEISTGNPAAPTGGFYPIPARRRGRR
jgi:hypothetical protein